MRTKALLIAAAAMAVGVVSSKAQVYSQNIVGYVNNPVPAGWSIQSAPFDAANGDSITNLVNNAPTSGPGTGPLDGSYLYVWTGSSFTTYTFDSTQPTGIADAADLNPLPGPILPPGTSFFIDNLTGATTNTYVGTVHIGSGTYPGTSTNLIASTTLNALVSPVIPVAGGVSSVAGLTNVLSAGPGTGNLDGEYLLFPVITGGAIHGYTTYTIDSTQPTGFADAADLNPEPEPQVPVGGGFFFNNVLNTTVTWIQSLGQ
jgi:hypothetical protein